MPENRSIRPSVQIINHALTSISVASAHVQLARRWLERGRLDQTEVILESLRVSERALQESAASVRELAGPTTIREHPPGENE